MKTIEVHAAPSEYILKEGAFELLEEKLQQRGIQSILVVTGTKSYEAAKAYWPEMPSMTETFYTYQGECSFAEIEEVVTRAKEVDAIVALGGGKVIDLAKAAANELHKQVIVLPTLASNCAPWTPLSVIYDNEGAFHHYDIYPIATSLLLVEPKLLLHAPRDLFVAGIGDTLAKWYEADVQLRMIEHLPVPLMISYEAAKQCKELLLRESKEALRAMDEGVLNDAFIQVVEVMFMYAGMVGGYGDHYGRTAGAHAVHNGLTALEKSHALLHGVKVAYGICVQLMLENRPEEVQALRAFYEELHLPQTLKELGLTEVTAQQLQEVAEKTTIPTESIHLMPIGEITSERVLEAMQELEQLV